MRPAFSSNRAVAAFALLMLGVFLLPLLLRTPCLPPRESLYATEPWGLGAFPYIHDQAFKTTGDIDIAFMGSSPISWGIDTPYVQAKLSEKLGRPAVVRSLGWNWPGYDPMYFIARDLLEHRRVRAIVFCDLSSGAPNIAHTEASHWFRFGENAPALAGLPLRSKASFYASAVVGMPRTLLSLLRSDRPAIPSDKVSWPGFVHVPNPASRLGSFAIHAGAGRPFVDFTPPTAADPSATVIYSPATTNQFRFSGQPLPPLQTAMTRKIATLAREHGVKLIYLHMPLDSEARSGIIHERVFWPDAFQGDVAMLGIPGASLFSGLSDEDVGKLFWDFQHLNENGQKYFTRAVTPSLLHVYESQLTP